MRGGVPRYVAQATSQFDAEIAEKGHLWMETSLFLPLNTIKMLVVFEVNNFPCHMLVGHTQLCAVMGHGFSYHG